MELNVHSGTGDRTRESLNKTLSCLDCPWESRGRQSLARFWEDPAHANGPETQDSLVQDREEL